MRGLGLDRHHWPVARAQRLVRLEDGGHRLRREHDAYTLFAYNVGGSAFCGSSLLKKLNAGDHAGACNGLMAWDVAGGKRIKGLTNRRDYERRMCLGERL